ncbi:hypothetical protein Tsp_14234 [Trichinella spiralis]|nr:hypothetical protein Tsp_14234 [Trichinella spiralis]
MVALMIWSAECAAYILLHLQRMINTKLSMCKFTFNNKQQALRK